MNQNKNTSKNFFIKKPLELFQRLYQKNKLVYENLFTELNLKTKFLKGCDKNHTSI